MDREKVTKILQKLSIAIPNPKTELHYDSVFELLIAVLLSAHTTDKSVNQATASLFKIANTPSKMLALGENELKKYINNIGLYNAKSANVIKTCKILVDKYQSRIPDTREELEQLPGVGRKTANVVLNVAFNQPTIAVDTHIFRVANRTKMAEGKNPFEVEQKLLACVPENFLKVAHHLLILHGKYVCKAKKPLCRECVIRDLCEYEDKE